MEKIPSTSDISFMAAYLYDNQMRFEDPISGFGDAVGKKNDYILLGFSANRAIGRLLLNFDLAFSHDVFVSFNFPGTSALASPLNLKKDRLGTSFGFEWAIDNQQSVSLGVQAQKLLDEREGLLPGQQLIYEGVYGSWLVRYTNNLLNSDLTVSSTLQGNIDGNSPARISLRQLHHIRQLGDRRLDHKHISKHPVAFNIF